MNKANGTITKGKDGNNWIVESEGYPRHTVQDMVKAISIHVLRTSPYIAIQLHNLLKTEKGKDYTWRITIAKAAMIAAEGMVLKPNENTLQNKGVSYTVAEVPDYDSPKYNVVSYFPKPEKMKLQCSCHDWRVAFGGNEEGWNEDVDSVPITENGVYCKHILAYLMIANSPHKLADKSPRSELVAVIVMHKLKHHYITEKGPTGTPSWIYKAEAIEMRDRNTVAFSVPRGTLWHTAKEEKQEAEELLKEIYPELDLEVEPVITEEKQEKETM
jgi:hypothetical protein